jgi:copper chaperone CopZ
MTTVKFATQPLTCPCCIAKIETTVARLDGVEDVKVMFNPARSR